MDSRRCETRLVCAGFCHDLVWRRYALLLWSRPGRLGRPALPLHGRRGPTVIVLLLWVAAAGRALLWVGAAGILKMTIKWVASFSPPVSQPGYAQLRRSVPGIHAIDNEKRQTLVRKSQYAFSRARGFCQENFEKAGDFGTVGWRFLRFACVPRRSGA